MKQSRIIILFILSLLSVACNNENKGEGTYYNDFETMGYWSESPKIAKNVGHSGNFCVFTDSATEYTEGFRLPVTDIKKSKPKYIEASGWVMSNDVNAKAQLVVTLDSVGKAVAWNGAQTQKVILGVGKWYELSVTIQLPENISPNEKILMYGWYGGGGKVYFDDLLLKVK